MKVLLSAYACEPNKGSEPGMGWHWAVEIARLGHEVHVLTRENNRQSGLRGLAQLEKLNITLHGYDLPRWARWWKKGMRGVHVYYLLWQWGAYRCARRLHNELRFDLVHHITFAVYRHPSFMGRLGIPFVFGPLGGGEDTPPGLMRSLPLRGRIAEMLRAAANWFASLDPWLQSAFREAALILYKTTETLGQIPSHFHGKCICVQDVATDTEALAAHPSPGAGAQFLFVGRLLYWKGVHLALRALAAVRRDLPEAKLTIAGAGRDRAWLEELARKLGVADALEWRGFLPREQVQKLYAAHCAFVFPSLHDSGGTVVMEAIAQGLPVVCLNLGGPGAILPDACGFKIHARDRNENEIVQELADAMKKLASDAALRNELAENALKAARELTWSALVSHAYAEIEKRCAPAAIRQAVDC